MNKRQRKKQIAVEAEKKRKFEKYVSQWRRDRRLRPHIERLENAMLYGDGCDAPACTYGWDVPEMDKATLHRFLYGEWIPDEKP